MQSWTATISLELLSLGHEVVEWGPEWPLPRGRFDAGIFANIGYTREALPLCDKTLVISHGIIKPERPEGDLIAFTSEGVRTHWGMDGPIIRQPIDLGFWHDAGHERDRLVRHSYRNGLDYLPKIAKRLGLKFVHCQRMNKFAVRDELQRASVVVATGRAACEAMACGAKVVIADDRPYQGPLLDVDIHHAMTENYSGRGGVAANSRLLADAIASAQTHQDHALKFHDSAKITRDILCLLC